MDIISVIGNYEFDDEEYFQQVLDPHLSYRFTMIKLVSRDSGAPLDLMVEEYSHFNGIPYFGYLPDWDKDGKDAIYLRDKELIASCDECVAFWDGESTNTKNLLHLCHSWRIPVKLIRIERKIIVPNQWIGPLII